MTYEEFLVKAKTAEQRVAVAHAKREELNKAYQQADQEYKTAWDESAELQYALDALRVVGVGV